jgi:hypothetical protein
MKKCTRRYPDAGELWHCRTEVDEVDVTNAKGVFIAQVNLGWGLA